jgi:hypothetical protein
MPTVPLRVGIWTTALAIVGAARFPGGIRDEDEPKHETAAPSDARERPFMRRLITTIALTLCAIVPVLAHDQSRPANPAAATMRHSTTEAEIEASLKASDLLHTIYFANHAKDKESIKLLNDAYKKVSLVDAKQINLAPEPLRRTALHWTVLGSLQAKPGKHLEAYLQLAEALIEL